MSRRIRAAGAVVLRELGGEKQVLLIHRPEYDDWTLPKGKALPDELRPATAVREVREETGVIIQLGIRLQSICYEVSKGRKRVDYWRATPIAQYYHAPDQEVDEVAWMPISEAVGVMTYEDEIGVLREALDAPETTPFLLVRHAKAMLRKHWSGNDQTRRLNGRGRRQARELIPLLEAFGVTRLITSASTRCAQTLAPYAEYRDIELELHELLTEEEGLHDLPAVTDCVRSLAEDLVRPTALCGHRPVLPAMMRGLDIEERHHLVAETTIIHRDAEGNNVKVEVHKPTA